MTTRSIAWIAATAAPLLAAYPLCVADDETLRCWPSDRREGQLALESDLLASVSAHRLREWHDLLASEPHVAGTPGDIRTAERIAGAFRQMGLEVQEHEIWVYLCEPRAAALEIVEPVRVELLLKETALQDDPYSSHPDLTYGWNAYSGSGDATAEVVYANYATKADFEKLASLGVDVRGKIVLARYGGNYRGYKVRFAQAAGASGLIIYTDPADSGYCKGITYPEGGYANDSFIQRGSIVTLPYNGDPLTPFVEATRDAPRLDPAEVDLPRIPVQPIGWSSAQQIIGRMTGPTVPAGWQGGLPFAYRLTGGEALKVRLKIEQERRLTRTLNVVGALRGQRRPDQTVIVGCHHDAWGFGAADPLAGTIALMESARCISEAARAGRELERSILFCAWGAEEFGIIGSSEWVEANRASLGTSAVAYFNLDMASMGMDFGSGASPSLQGVIADAAGAVPQPGAPDGGTVLSAWFARAPDARWPRLPRFGDLGGGSDHVGFLCHAGVACASLGAGGAPGTSYHSTYDNLAWYRKVVGEDYQSARMVTQAVTIALARLATAPVLPLDFAKVGPDVRRHLEELTARARQLGVLEPDAGGTVPKVADMLGPLDDTAAAYTVLAEITRARLLDAAAGARVSAQRMDEINAVILAMDRAWLSDRGLPGRPWFRNTYAATDEDSGYAPWMLPLLRHAIEHKEPQVIKDAVEAYQRVLSDLAEKVRRIDALLN